MRSGLRIISTLMIIAGVIITFSGLSMMAVFFAAGTGSNAARGALMGLVFILIVCNGVLEFIGGFLGHRAVKDSSKAKPAFIFGVITLFFTVVSTCLDFSFTNLVSCLFPVLYSIFTWKLYKEYEASK